MHPDVRSIVALSNLRWLPGAVDERAHTYTRLQALKRTYDPENVFRLNQNIRPA